MEYRNEEEKPSMPKEGHMLRGMGVDDMKGEAMPIAYGQASKEGCKRDNGRISSQFKDYHWE
jgi:hypothetical protein